jgi:hypothetical protein
MPPSNARALRPESDPWRMKSPRRCCTPRQAVRRELLEEISWEPAAVECVMVHHIHRRTAHVFRAELSVPLEQLQLLEGQDLGLVTPEELRSGSIWSNRLGSLRPVADGLQELMQHVITGQR